MGELCPSLPFPCYTLSVQDRSSGWDDGLGDARGGFLGICSPKGEGRKQQHVQTQLLALLTPHSPL